jgi:dihydrofolate reductase
MRKVILGVAVSLDGFIEGPKGEYDWCFTDQDYGMTEFLNRVDAIFYGRKSYEMMTGAEAPAGENPWAGKKNYVFSNTIKTAPKDVELISGDIRKEVARIKSMKGKDIWLFGGALLTTNLMNEGLVDELWLAVHPILLGKGKPLFSGIEKRVTTKLIRTQNFNTGLVSLSYEVVNK